MIEQVSLPPKQKAMCFHCGAIIKEGSVCYAVRGSPSYYIAVECKPNISWLKDLEIPVKQ
jgi:hypothetical protein